MGVRRRVAGSYPGWVRELTLTTDPRSTKRETLMGTRE